MKGKVGVDAKEGENKDFEGGESGLGASGREGGEVCNHVKLALFVSVWRWVEERKRGEGRERGEMGRERERQGGWWV